MIRKQITNIQFIARYKSQNAQGYKMVWLTPFKIKCKPQIHRGTEWLTPVTVKNKPQIHRGTEWLTPVTVKIKPQIHRGTEWLTLFSMLVLFGLRDFGLEINSKSVIEDIFNQCIHVESSSFDWIQFMQHISFAATHLSNLWFQIHTESTNVCVPSCVVTSKHSSTLMSSKFLRLISTNLWLLIRDIYHPYLLESAMGIDSFCFLQGSGVSDVKQALPSATQPTAKKKQKQNKWDSTLHIDFISNVLYFVVMNVDSKNETLKNLFFLCLCCLFKSLTGPL